MLNTGDAIFLYTDGITEAVNPENEIYGEARLEECMNEIGVAPVEEVIQKVKENVRAFIRGHSQSDDATMLMFQYNKTIRNFTKPALKENYKDFKEWLHTTCKEWELNEDISNKLDMCGEELFANICFYAYPNETGDLSVTLEKNDKLVTMVWEDSGVIYNPLQKPDPDLDIPPRERKLGGLGIFMVKQMANDIKYQRINNKNILTLVFEV
jgi:sigma-B regulation protein RsbU (phosphoserine phosphatase)